MRPALVLVSLALAALVLVLYFPNVIPGVRASGAAVGPRVGGALVAAFAAGAVAARLAPFAAPMGVAAGVALPASAVLFLLGIVTAMRPTDILLVALLGVLFLGTAMAGGALSAKGER